MQLQEDISTCKVGKIVSKSNGDSCLVEENISNFGFDINNGNTDPKQNDAASCRSFCEANYPTAKYFDWISPSHR